MFTLQIIFLQVIYMAPQTAVAGADNPPPPPSDTAVKLPTDWRSATDTQVYHIIK